MNIGFLNPLDLSQTITAKHIFIIPAEDIDKKIGHEEMLTLQKPVPILGKKSAILIPPKFKVKRQLLSINRPFNHKSILNYSLRI